MRYQYLRRKEYILLVQVPVEWKKAYERSFLMIYRQISRPAVFLLLLLLSLNIEQNHLLTYKENIVYIMLSLFFAIATHA